MELYIDNKIINTYTDYSLNKLLKLQILWDSKPETYYTLIIYDLDTCEDSTCLPFVILLVTNIINNDILNGNIIFKYLHSDFPKYFKSRRYFIKVYQQQDFIPDISIDNRNDFPLYTFELQFNLKLLDYKILIIDPKNKRFYQLKSLDETKYNPERPLIIKDSDLTESEQKFCSCVVQVSEKQPSECNIEKAWYKIRRGKKCYNPFSVCSKTTQGSNSECNKNYNYELLTDRQLNELANLSDIKTSPFNRKRIIKSLQK